ncbi:MAG: hypothetical protein PHE77_01590, partial [Candidatus Pacebacteria bacterium]|nr:hypothetical protein [Candidatus Paceibacterota bacterium]
MRKLIITSGIIFLTCLGVFGLAYSLEATETCQTKCSADGAGLQYCLSCDTVSNACLQWSSVYPCSSGACSAGACSSPTPTGQVTVSLAPINMVPGAVSYDNILIRVSASDSAYPGRISKICLNSTDLNLNKCQTCWDGTSCSYDFDIMEGTSGIPSGTWRFYGLAFSSQNQELARSSILMSFTPITPSCSDECTNGAKRCSTNSQYQVCGNFDSDSCLEWSTSYTCPTNQTCSGNGVCSLACTNQCQTMSAWQCPTTNTYKICGDFNNDSCLEWSSAYTCDTGYTCNATSKQCVAQNDNPTSAYLSINKTSVLVGEKANISISAQDNDGVAKVCLSDGDYQTPECFSGASHTWEISKQTPGTYFFYGYAYGKKPNGEIAQITTTPFFVSLTVKSQPIVCTNQCQTMSAWQCPTTNTYQICGDFNNDSCLEWSQTYTCDTGYTCSASGKTCQAVGDNPTTGTLTATKTTALTGENVSFTVKGYDTDGITKVCLLDGEQQTPVCQNVSTYTWNLTKQTPGTYFFYGYVYGKRPNGEQVERTTDPFFVKVSFQGQAPVCNNLCTPAEWSCPTANTYKVCGDYNNDGCYEWSSAYTCNTGYTCSASQRMCILQNNNQGTINLTANKTQALIGENVSFTFTAQDQDGIDQICLITDNYSNALCKQCSGQTSCSNTWNTTKQTPGLYSFSGYAVTKTPQGSTQTINSNIVSVLFNQPGTVCTNQCQTMSAWQCPTTNTYQICGDFNNDSCLEWSQTYTCDT